MVDFGYAVNSHYLGRNNTDGYKQKNIPASGFSVPGMGTDIYTGATGNDRMVRLDR